MTSLTQRLSLLRKQSGDQLKPASEIIRQNSLTDKLKFSRARHKSSSSRSLNDEDVAKLINGKILKPGLISVRSTLDLSSLHSHYNAQFDQPLSFLSPGLTVENCLFIDTETSGLSSAAGTVVFLLGIGEIVGKSLILEQLLLTRLAAEKHMLDWFNEKCDSKTHFVSYNGKSFDIPLIENRFRMNRMKGKTCNEHVDLLHWIRRLHNKNMQDCRLPSAEKYCLNFSRNNDLPGSEAPSVWQDFIRHGRCDRLKALMQHHAWDIISLVGLLHHAEKALGQGNGKSLDHYSAAKYFISHNKSNIAKRILTENYSQLNSDALFLLSLIYRREKNWHESLVIWKRLNSIAYIPAIECLAKYYEHVGKDVSQALFYTTSLINHDNIHIHHKRMQRLQRKGSKREIFGEGNGLFETE